MPRWHVDSAQRSIVLFRVPIERLLVPGHDVPQWSAALEALLDDPARRAELAARGVAHARGFGWDGTAERLLAVYAEAAASRRSDTLEALARASARAGTRRTA